MTLHSNEIYTHVLLAIDFSADTECLLKKTLKIAAAFEAKLSVVHILDNIPMPDVSYGTILALDDESDNALLQREKTKLNEYAMRLNVPPEQRWLIWGSPKEEICALATQEKVDLIIVGSHERHRLAWLLGSTANDVLRRANCDVLAVKLDA